jgi:hypothetical protein
MGITLPTYGTGTFTLNQSTYSPTMPSYHIGINENGTMKYSTGFGGSVVVNVTEFPSNVNGVIKGTFSGTIGKSPSIGGGTTSISGSFDALRYD